MGVSGVGNSPSPPPNVEDNKPIDVPDYEPPGVVERPSILSRPWLMELLTL